MYAPNEEEVEKLKGFDEDLTKLNEVDKLAIKVSDHLTLVNAAFTITPRINFSSLSCRVSKQLQSACAIGVV